ncbi:MAG: hypothetical protein V1798_00300 [Pseudomonadota bacterium]
MRIFSKQIRMVKRIVRPIFGALCCICAFCLAAPVSAASRYILWTRGVDSSELQATKEGLKQAFALAKQAGMRFNEGDLNVQIEQFETDKEFSDAISNRGDPFVEGVLDASLNLVRIDAPPKLSPKELAAETIHEAGHFVFVSEFVARKHINPVQHWFWRFVPAMVPDYVGTSAAFNELWADLLAVIVLKDPEVIANALRTNYGSFIESESNFVQRTRLLYKKASRDSTIAPRSFENHCDARTWTQAEPHLALAPVRGFLGQRLENTPDAELLRVTFDAIFDVFEHNNVATTSVPQMNQILIRALQARLAQLQPQRHTERAK